MALRYYNPTPDFPYHHYTIYLAQELVEKDYYEALRSVAVLTFNEPEGTQLFLPVEVIAVLMLEEKAYKARMKIEPEWKFVFPIEGIY